MSHAELLTTTQTVPSGEAPWSDKAQPVAGAARAHGGFFGTAGTVDDQLSRLEIRLLAEVEDDPVVEQHVRRLLSLAHARFAGATVRRFLPILIERDVRRQLDGR
jgi:hypothetical protein